MRKHLALVRLKYQREHLHCRGDTRPACGFVKPVRRAYVYAARNSDKMPPVARSVASRSSPNQVLTHAARAAAKQLNKVPFQAPLVAARGAREGHWLE